MPDDGTLQIPDSLQFRKAPEPGRSVANPDEMRRFHAISAIPRFADAQGYYNYLKQKIDQATSHWKTFGDATSEQYARAYREQETALKTLKEKYEVRSKQQEALCTFALNLLTVGIAGPLAGQAAKFAVKGVSSDREFIEKAVDLAKEKVTEPVKTATEWGYKKLSGELAADPFMPAAASPAEFGAKVSKGINSRNSDMQDLLMALLESKDGLTVDGIKRLCEQIIPDPYIQSMPKGTLDESAIRKGAALSLWLAWGWARDVRYWYYHGSTNDFYKYQDERLDYKEIMLALRDAGVPAEVASQKDTLSHWMGRYEQIDEINMPGFIDWCNSGRWCQTMGQIFTQDRGAHNFWVQELPGQYAQMKMKQLTAFMGGKSE